VRLITCSLSSADSYAILNSRLPEPLKSSQLYGQSTPSYKHLLITMFDPITVVGLVASITQLIITAAEIFMYINYVKGARKDRGELSLEVANLIPLLANLRHCVEQADPNDVWISSLLELGEPMGPIEEFEKAMNRLKKNLRWEKGPKRLVGNLLWARDKGKIRDLLFKIERFKTLLAVALQKDQLQVYMNAS
jgi:hypothetical protein